MTPRPPAPRPQRSSCATSPSRSAPSSRSAPAPSTVDAGSIHALVGENGAGKSTLVKIIAGLYRRDAGEFLLDGETVDFTSTAEAKAAGIAVIYQEPTLFPDLSVTENIFMGRQPPEPLRPHRPPRDARRGDRRCSSASASTSTPTARRAASRSPTSRSSRSPRRSRSTPGCSSWTSRPRRLSGVEVDRLFAVARSLRDEGRAAALHLAPLRRGVRPLRHRHRDARRRLHLDRRRSPTRRSTRSCAQMVGREVADLFPKTEAEIGDVVLEVERPHQPRASSTTLLRGARGRDRRPRRPRRRRPQRDRPGDLRRRPLRLRPRQVDGRACPRRDPPPRCAPGLALVPEDRRKQGLVIESASRATSTLAIRRQLAKLGLLINRRRERAAARLGRAASR